MKYFGHVKHHSSFRNTSDGGLTPERRCRADQCAGGQRALKTPWA